MIDFDPELDCSQLDVFQPLVIEAFDNCVLLKQWDGAGEGYGASYHCIGIPTKHLDALIGALTVANKNREQELVVDFARKDVYFVGEKDEA